jgi:uncharacterized protein
MDPTLAPLRRTKTILLTTFRRDGTPVPTPVSIAFDGDRALIRTWETAHKAVLVPISHRLMRYP